MAEGHYGHGSDAYRNQQGLEHSKDGMSHASHKNVSPGFDTGFMDAGPNKRDPSHFEGGLSPNSVQAPHAAGSNQNPDSK